MRTIAFDDYEPALLRHVFSTRVLHAGTRGVGFASLSPFDIPEEVLIRTLPEDRCTVEFIYANHETPEKSTRQADDTGIELLLGEYSKKVLAVIIPHACQRLLSGPLTFDLHGIMELSQSLRPDAVKSCARSAVLVQAILQKMPSRLRKEIVKALQDDLVHG